MAEFQMKCFEISNHLLSNLLHIIDQLIIPYKNKSRCYFVDLFRNLPRGMMVFVVVMNEQYKNGPKVLQKCSIY